MRIGVLSDTHIADSVNDIPVEVINAFKEVDMVIHAGDIVNLEVLDKLSAVCKNIKAVWGNMDSLEVKNKLPQKEIIKAGKYTIGVMHGYGHPDRLTEILKNEFADKKVDIIIFGHSHRSLNEKINNILYFNPGSPTDKVFATDNSYGIIEINDNIEAKIIKLKAN